MAEHVAINVRHRISLRIGGLTYEKTHRLVSPALLLFCGAALSIPTSAQTVYGSIVGTITDAAAQLFPAPIHAGQPGTNEQKATLSGNDGNYVFVNLLPGNYSVTVEKGGFRRMVRQPVTVEVQSAIRIDASMQVGEGIADPGSAPRKRRCCRRRKPRWGRSWMPVRCRTMPLTGATS